MSITDPKSKAEIKALQAAERRGETLSKNDKHELDQAYRFGVVKKDT